MMEDNLLAELREIIANVLDVDEELIDYETHFVNDLGVDSLMALEVMVTLERKYKIRMSEEDLKRISCLRDAHELLLSRLQASPSPTTAP
jgi:acyl carrier protein